MVVISLYAEIVALGIEKNTIRNENTFLYCNLYIENKYKKIIYILNSFTFILIASGTIIWGYGDILYKI